MKKIILVIVMLVLLATIANAASVNGDFEGNPIIKMKSNGKILPVGDVPAILYNGRTMIPIYMLSQLGITVTWDQKTNSVDVVTDTSNDSVDILKDYSTAMDIYRSLGMFGDRANQIREMLSIVNQIIDIDNRDIRTAESLKSVHDFLNGLYNEYNTMNADIRSSMIASKYITNFEIEIISGVLEQYVKILDQYALTELNLFEYALDKNIQKHTEYTNNYKKAILMVEDAKSESDSGYDHFYNLIQNY